MRYRFLGYDADDNDSIVFHGDESYERNDSVALDHLLVYLPFDETNGSLHMIIPAMPIMAIDRSGSMVSGEKWWFHIL